MIFVKILAGARENPDIGFLGDIKKVSRREGLVRGGWHAEGIPTEVVNRHEDFVNGLPQGDMLGGAS